MNCNIQEAVRFRFRFRFRFHFPDLEMSTNQEATLMENRVRQSPKWDAVSVDHWDWNWALRDARRRIDTTIDDNTTLWNECMKHRVAEITMPVSAFIAAYFHGDDLHLYVTLTQTEP